MRSGFTFLFLILLWNLALAQPSNDECATATILSLSSPTPCNNGSSTPVTDVFSMTNVDATPTSPYPTFTGCSGGNSATLASEVWFFFQSTSNIIDITVNGLNTPNIILYSGVQCEFLNAIDCAVASPGSGTVTLSTSAVGENLTYFIMISGGDIDDQGPFDISITSSLNCTPCLFQNNFTATPPPVNGTYSSGQQVTFCYTVDAWLANAGGTEEWLHSLEVFSGSGWASFNPNTGPSPQPPPSCDGQGTWAWFPPWTSCQTGMTFGPGFAYDSAAGIDAGGNCNTNGTPNDGDPGNNYGDGQGNGCNDVGINSAPKTFCWTLTVPSCPPGVNGGDLSVTAIVHSDGESGSWTQTGCNTGTTYDFFASAVCCDDGDPNILALENITCPGNDDGSVTVFGSSAPGTVFTYTLFDQNGNLVPGFPAVTSDQPVTFAPLPPGNNYSVVVQNPASGCNKSINFNILDGTLPTASISDDLPACLGDVVTLVGSISPPTAPVTFSWSGPGLNSTNQTVMITQPGTYTLTASTEGCEADPVTFTYNPTEPNVTLTPDDNAVCAGETVTFTAAGGASYSWLNLTTGETAGDINPYVASITTNPTTVEVTGYDANGCSATDEVTITVDDPPVLTEVISGDLCEGGLAIVTINGADVITWADNGTTDNPRIFNLAAGTYQYDLMGTDLATGCSSFLTINLEIIASPSPIIIPNDAVICPGDNLTLTAIGDANSTFNWSTGENNVSSITVSPTEDTFYSVVETNNGCTGTFEVLVLVQVPLPAPVVTCGAITSNSVEFLWNDIPQSTGYTVNVLTGQSGTLNGTTFTVNNLDPSEAVTIEVSATGTLCGGLPFTITCTSESCPPVDMNITPVADLCLNSGLTTIQLEVIISNQMGGGDSLWNGNGVVDPFNGIFDPVLADTGAHEVIFTYEEGLCTYRDTIIINVFQTPTANFDISSSAICLDDSLSVTYTGNATTAANYIWDFDGGTAVPGTGQGSHLITWASPGDKTITLTVEENNCVSEIFTQTLTVSGPLAAPAVICGSSTTTSVEFNWNDVPGANGYSVNVLTGQTGTLSGTTYSVNNLLPNEIVTIEVIVQDDGPCANVSTEMTCVAASCPAFGLDIDPVDDICLVPNAPTVTLTATVSGGDGSGILSWSGPGVVDALGGTLAPSAAGPGMHMITLTYAEGPCTAQSTVIVNIFDTPTADFTVASTPICIGATSTLTYTGSADPGNANFTWNFGGGTAVPGTGAGPHDVSWVSAGDKTITLIVTENGCTSEVFEQIVQVESPLAAPVINCNPSSTEITFTWDDVVGAVDYNVTVLTGQPGTQNGNSFTLTGLIPLETVTIVVEAVGTGPCGNISAETTCVAEDCPDVQISIDVVAPLCFYPFTVPTNLNAQISGGLGGGVKNWDGPGIIDNTNGTFDPQVAGTGTHTINFTYSEGTCTYNSSTTIVINAVPTASFTLDDPVCINQVNNVLFSGSAGAGATYNWGFDGGTIQSGTNQGPFEISWATSGTKTVSLIVTENDCVSDPFDLSLQVEDPLADPVISCESTDSSVTFSWLDVAGTTGYQIMGPAGTQIGNSYEITGLLPGTEVNITVIAETDNPCGNSSATANCVASDCPEVTLNINAPATLCANDGIQTFTASPQGGTGTGTGVWFGTGIIDANAGTFNPAAVSGQTVTIQYIFTENVICVTDTTFEIIIYEIPDASFTVDSPICEDGSATAVFNGNAPTGSTFDWNFGGGTSTLPATDEGPHNISWNTAGVQIVTLQLSNNGCLSPSTSQQVEVVATLADPVISCGTSTTSSVTFSWDPVPGATGYQVMDINGPAGTLSGTTYTVTGLTPEQIITIEVTALSNGICGNTSATASCSALACPEVTVEVSGPNAVCMDDNATFELVISGSTDNFEVVYSVNSNFPITENFSGTGTVNLGQITTTTTVEIVSFTNLDASECSYFGNSAWTIILNEPQSAGTALNPLRFCMNTAMMIGLSDLLIDADTGGYWTETSDMPSSPGAFNATQGTFNIFDQSAGTYKFTYAVNSPDPCPDDQTEVMVIIDPLPVADAGADQTIFCNLGLVSIGSSGSSSGAGISYYWIAPNGVNIPDPSQLLIDVSQEGVFTLEVTNEFGCVSSDDVEVDIKDDVPGGDLSFNDISCFEANDGFILLQNVTGGTPPYEYSLNGAAFSNQSTFSGLSAGAYSLIVQDVNGCFSEYVFDLTEPNELIVNLVTNIPGDPIIEYGDTIQLTVEYQSSIPIDTIMWIPATIAKEGEGTVVVGPTVTTTYSVTVIDVNGCSDSDNLTIFVKKSRPVFIPNVFSPNNDGINDILFINAGNAVVNIKSFMIFNRWGEAVFERNNFPPNDPTLGWSGKHRGKIMNPAVFTYFAEVEFTDGEVILYKGDITLVR